MGSSAGETSVGVAVSKEELEDFVELRSLVQPTESVRLLDDFARWLFGSTAIVGTLGAGLGLSGVTDLGDRGNDLFAAAVICVALSLVLATLARIPRRLEVNRYSADSMRESLHSTVVMRGRLLSVAGVLFALALFLAGIAPIV